MSLAQLQKRMKWPARQAIFSPSGIGPRLLAELAREKIQAEIRRCPDGGDAHLGILTKNPGSNDTEAPLALVCEFPRPVCDDTLAACHRLAWLFVRAPLLVTVEPHRVRTWTCCERPATKEELRAGQGEIAEAGLDLTASLSPSEQAAHALHWVRLASGDFYRQFPDRFRRDGRADRLLLEALKYVRRRLQKEGLDKDRIHDLLARVVFSQFLFDRKDSDGRPAINAGLLSRLREDGDLSREHSDLGSILADYREAYRFFRWLNDKFNGDLFPGKGATDDEREAEWQAEMAVVQPRHLKTLADFVSGRLRGPQRFLWRLYSFDVVPLEFISSIYEEFVTAKGAHYTPGYLVDFMLDDVLPWGGDQWDLKILDPACGSGIFLVKAYQRLIQRWKNAHPDQKPAADDLRKILQRNVFGVDVDPHAVRVASFSLYLTMCDELDPKSYLNSTEFPPLRDQTLIYADFFREDVRGFSTARDAETYDLVVGNAPWGKGTATEHAKTWAKNPAHHWPIANKGFGTLFLAKAATLAKRNGRVSMIQPASSLLFHRGGPAKRFREKLFSAFKVDQVVNLSTLRFELFEGVASPPCIVSFRPTEPDDAPLVYISPKQIRPIGGAQVTDSQYTIVIEPHDISRIWPDEAISEPLVWTALAWGGRRDLSLMKKLQCYDTLASLEAKGVVTRRKGIVRGNERKPLAGIRGKRILETSTFPESAFLWLPANSLPINKNEFVDDDDSTDIEPFEIPQLILKKSWQAQTGRVQAVRILSDARTGGVVCSQSYVTVHSSGQNSHYLDRACLSFNSIFAVYFLLLSSGRLASYRPEALVEEVLGVPLPDVLPHGLEELRTNAEVDGRSREAFALKDAEWTLVDDLVRFTLPDFKGDETSPGRQPTERAPRFAQPTKREPQLAAYCRYFARVLKAGFGQDKPVCATIFQDDAQSQLPVRLVAIHLDWPRDEPIVVEPIDSAALCELLLELDRKWLTGGQPNRGGIFYQRVAMIYSKFQHQRRSIPTVYIVKPDRIRYWTRSAALRDADEVAADVQLWRQQARPTSRARK
jgi:hypothetical protein